MRVSKWGNSLAIRLSADLVRSLGLKEGDQVEVAAATPERLELAHDLAELKAIDARLQALDRIRALRRPLPAGYRFDRNEANLRAVEQ